MEPIEDIINVSSKNTEENNTSKRTGQWIKKPSDNNPKSFDNNSQNKLDLDIEELDDISNIPKDIKFFIE